MRPETESFIDLTCAVMLEAYCNSMNMWLILVDVHVQCVLAAKLLPDLGSDDLERHSCSHL